jgi:hypothetical protein
MADLLGQNVGTNYKGILNLTTLNVGLDTNLQFITDGEGTNSSLSISENSISINDINVGNGNREPGIFNADLNNVNISVNPNTIVISDGYSTGSYDSGATPPDNAPSAIFEMASTTQGMLLPRMTRIEREAIKAPADGLMVYDTTTAAICYYLNPDWYKIDSTLIV